MADANVTAHIKVTEDGASQTKDKIEGVTEATEDFKDTAKKTTTETKKLSESTKNLGTSCSKATKGVNKFVTSLKRIFLYRTIRKVLSEIFQALKEGIANVYQYSVALNNTDSTQAAKNLDSLATSILYVSNSLGAMLTPAIQMITPLVANLSEWFSRCANSVNQVLSALAGNDTYTYALRFGTTFADNMSDASASAKDIKRTLMGFDEINRLDAPDTGSGSSGSAIDYGSMFDEGVVSEKFKTIATIIKDVVLPALLMLGSVFSVAKIVSTITGGIDKFLGKWLKAQTVVKSGLVSLIGGIATVVGGIALVVVGIVDIMKNGTSLKGLITIIGGIALVVGGLALAFGGTAALIGLAVGAIVASIAWIVAKAKEMGITWEDIGDAIVYTWNNIKTKVADFIMSIGYALTNFVGVKVPNALRNFGKNVYDATVGKLISAFNTAKTKASEFINSLKKTFNSFSAKIKTPHLTWTTQAIPSSDWKYKILNALNLPTSLPKLNVSWYAKGGFPTQGQLFIANEMGAEMVGSMNGKTTVANNQQIVEGIKRGVMEAMQQGGDQNIVLNVDGKQLFDIMVGRNNSIVRTSGRSPLLV